jgi:hypothetical protein
MIYPTKQEALDAELWDWIAEYPEDKDEGPKLIVDVLWSMVILVIGIYAWNVA